MSSSNLSDTHECMVTLREEILLNQLGSGAKPMSAGIEWFNELPSSKRQEILYFIATMLYQAHPSESEAADAVKVSGLKPTLTPCVLLTKGDLKSRIAQVTNLPEQEWETAFQLLIPLYGIADRRRRESEPAGVCKRHWWHWDLRDPLVIARIYVLRVFGRL